MLLEGGSAIKYSEKRLTTSISHSTIQRARICQESKRSSCAERRRGLVYWRHPSKPRPIKTSRNCDHSRCGYDVDFVNLRCEEYYSDSRIPEMKFGTALEDARRRDFTVNALFYNVHSGLVEDFTGNGLSDLKEGIIRTPLPAMETFSADPLRMLRAIRFASRFGFDLDSGVAAALRAPINVAALRSKVSKERVGTELMGMLAGPRPYQAIEYIFGHGLHHAIFEMPPICSDSDNMQERWATALQTVRSLHDVSTMQPSLLQSNRVVIEEDENVKRERQALIYLSAILFSFTDLTYPVKSKRERVGMYVGMVSIKWKRSHVIAALEIAEACSVFKYLRSNPDKVLAARTVCKLKSNWTLSLTLAAARECSSTNNEGEKVGILEFYSALRDTIEDTWKLNGYWSAAELSGEKI